MMQVLERIFPSLRKSEEAREIKQEVDQAKERQAAATDIFMASIEKMILHHDRVRHELAVFKKEKRAQRHASTNRR